MSKPKEMGKPVSELTPDELQRERQRCRVLGNLYSKKIAGKGLQKRLHEIEKRIRTDE